MHDTGITLAYSLEVYNKPYKFSLSFSQVGKQDTLEVTKSVYEKAAQGYIFQSTK